MSVNLPFNAQQAKGFRTGKLLYHLIMAYHARPLSRHYLTQRCALTDGYPAIIAISRTTARTRGSHSLKEKRESFWPKKLSHWRNWNSTRDFEWLEDIWVKLIRYWEPNDIGEYLSQIDSVLRVKWHWRILKSNWLGNESQIVTRNPGSNFSSASDSIF